MSNRRVISSVEVATTELYLYNFRYSYERLCVLMDVHQENYHQFNCWGTTAFMLGWVDEVNWLHGGYMEELLEHHTEAIDLNEVVPGDIYVQSEFGLLAHTCLSVQSAKDVDHIKNLMLFQKNGWTPVTMLTVGEIDQCYGHGEFVRPKPESIRR